jgi:hypothetical protein
MLRRALKAPARRILEWEVPIIKGMLQRGDKQHDIAARFGVNGGRIAEIKTGKKWPDQPALPFDGLPQPGPVRAADSDHLILVLNVFLQRLGQTRFLAILRSFLDELESESEGGFTQ